VNASGNALGPHARRNLGDVVADQSATLQLILRDGVTSDIAQPAVLARITFASLCPAVRPSEYSRLCLPPERNTQAVTCVLL